MMQCQNDSVDQKVHGRGLPRHDEVDRIAKLSLLHHRTCQQQICRTVLKMVKRHFRRLPLKTIDDDGIVGPFCADVRRQVNDV